MKENKEFYQVIIKQMYQKKIIKKKQHTKKKIEIIIYLNIQYNTKIDSQNSKVK